MKNLSRFPLMYLSVLLMGLFSCNSEDPTPENDGEVITDVVLKFQEIDASGNPVGLAFSHSASDPEGIEVGATPTIEQVTLTRGKTYRMEIEVLNSIEGESITEEILAEADVHQFFFLGSAFEGNPGPVAISYDDEGGIALGVKTKLIMAASPGRNNAQMRIVLRHDLNKNFPGANNPVFVNYEQAGGESDLDITFPLVIN
ncbi:hypothetical protein [Algoriphagus sanaruensis]|uniref:Type 1 periplasmic binding fold superfamily protein n=1 Tax=Algoriphagus sanaruensis TaxID=1727163 RepID=A0A142ENF5_9BACT|nr:hypothetical protein [Algoriphagus sanaruensis]AMQ56660.1 hypothetical protein AO498_09525 [Algoriphagus sanaruensis]